MGRSVPASSSCAALLLGPRAVADPRARAPAAPVPPSRAPERQRYANFKLMKHRQFKKVNADDSDVTDVDSEDEVRACRWMANLRGNPSIQTRVLRAKYALRACAGRLQR